MRPAANIGTSENNFFQSDRDLINSERRRIKRELKDELVGHPIKLNIKILDFKLDINDGDVVFIAQADSRIRRLNWKTEKTIAFYQGHTAPVTTIQPFISQQKQYLASGSWDKTLKIWDLENNKALYQYQDHLDFIKCVIVAYIDNLCVIYSGSADGDIRKYELGTLKCNKVLKGHTRGIEDLKTSMDSQYLFSCSGDLNIIQWSVKADTQIRKIRAHEATIYRIFITDEIWTASADKSSKCISLENWEVSTKWEQKEQVRTVMVTKNNRYVVSGGRDEAVNVFDLQEDKFIGSFQGHWDEVIALLDIPQCDTILSASLDGSIRKWKLNEVGNQVDLDDLAPSAFKDSSYGNKNQLVMTEEEEKELAELMEDD